jgi:hypothetical protein
VQTGALFGKLRSIVSGLSVDDRVITNGLMHARPGSTVAPTEQPIELDETAFTDPGDGYGGPVADENISSENMKLAMASGPSTQPSGGNHR